MNLSQTVSVLAPTVQAATPNPLVMQQARIVYLIPSMFQFVTPSSYNAWNSGFNADVNTSYEISCDNLQVSNTKPAGWLAISQLHPEMFVLIIPKAADSTLDYKYGAFIPNGYCMFQN